jgi:KAP family P-loop domain/Predicted Peptidoglycan domain
MSETIVRGQLGKEVEHLQRMLGRAGQRVTVDGLFGPRTQAAVASFLRARGRAGTGASVDAELLDLIEGASSRRPGQRGVGTDASGVTSATWSMPMAVVEDRSNVDCLGVRAEAQAFARLVCSRRTGTPLSVGLFGNSGSGKSFFMSKLQGEIEARCAAFTRLGTKLRAQGDEAGLLALQQRWYGRIAQITFNAWHYAEPNLWASLVTRVFDELATIVSPGESVEDTRARLLSEVSEGKQRREQAKLELRKAEAQLAEARAERERRETEAQRVREQLAVVEAVAPTPSPAGEGPDGEPAARLTVKGPVAALRVTLRWIWSRGRWPRVALVAAGVLLVVGVVLGIALWRGWWTGWLDPSIAVATSAVGACTGAATTLTAWWAFIQPQIDQTRSAHEAYLAHRGTASGLVDRALEDLLRPTEGTLATARRRMEEAEVGLDSAKIASDQACENVARARRTLQDVEGGQRFYAFVRDRDEGDDYRRHLGLVSLVRDDFLRLEQILDQVEREGPSDGELAPLSRIVLYIDDLDRCEPARVVEVLQALHLLLATPIFVVVVAADVRWLRRSLALYYERLLPRTGTAELDDGLDPTPRSHLESIFQVPFSLRPIDMDGFASLVHQVVQPRMSAAIVRESSERLAEVRGAAADESVATPDDVGATTVAPPPSPKPEASSATPLADAERLRMQAELESDLLDDAALALDATEIAFLERLHGVVGTPRLAKALVNTYRLLRAEIEAGLLPSYVTQGTCRGVLTLLAIQVGRPGEALRLFDALHQTTRATLGEVLAELAEQASSDRREARWQALATAVREAGAAEARVAELQPWTARIRRLSFEPWPPMP